MFAEVKAQGEKKLARTLEDMCTKAEGSVRFMIPEEDSRILAQDHSRQFDYCKSQEEIYFKQTKRVRKILRAIDANILMFLRMNHMKHEPQLLAE